MSVKYSEIKCPKCGEMINIDPYEFCCPICGEFIKEIDDTAVLNNHDSREYIVEEKKVNRLQKTTSIMFVVLSILLSVLSIGCVIALINPKIIFKYVHFGWILGSVLLVYLIAVLSSMIIHCKIIATKYEAIAQVVKHIKIQTSIIKKFAFVTTLTMIIVLTTTQFRTIDLCLKEDFAVLKNLPWANNCKYQLTNDIDFENTSPDFWNALNLGENGVFDGNGFSLRNVHIENGDDYVSLGDSYYGLFGINKGVIKNVKIENCVIAAKSRGSYFQMGTLCGENKGTIKDCEVIDVYLIQDGSSCYLGGIAGRNWSGTIENCKFINHNYRTEYPSALQSGSKGWLGFYHIDGISCGHKHLIKNCVSDYK